MSRVAPAARHERAASPGERVRRILGLGLPIIGGMLSQNLLNLIDTAMVGRLGAAALGAVGFGGMVNWLCGAFFLAMGSGVQAIAARRTGEGTPRGAVFALHGALLVALVVVLPYALLLSLCSREIFSLLSSDPAVVDAGAPYLTVRLCSLVFVVINFSFRGFWNGIGRSTVYLRTILLIHATNIFLNWVLIYGNLGFPPLGVTGAGIASAVAVATGSTTYVALAWRHARADGFLGRGGLPAGTVRGVLRLSIPAGVQNLFMAAGFVTFYRIAQILGTAELAATNVLVTLSLVCILPAIGLGLAGATLVGQALGARRPADATRWGWTTVWIAAAALALLGGTLAVAPRLWLSLLVNDPVADEVAVIPLVLLAVFQPVDSVGMVLMHILIGVGAVRTVMVSSIILQWVLFLPGAYLLAARFGGGLLALWIAMVAWRGIFAGVMALTFARGGWARTKV